MSCNLTRTLFSLDLVFEFAFTSLLSSKINQKNYASTGKVKKTVKKRELVLSVATDTGGS